MDEKFINMLFKLKNKLEIRNSVNKILTTFLTTPMKQLYTEEGVFSRRLAGCCIGVNSQVLTKIYDTTRIDELKLLLGIVRETLTRKIEGVINNSELILDSGYTKVDGVVLNKILHFVDLFELDFELKIETDEKNIYLKLLFIPCSKEISEDDLSIVDYYNKFAKDEKKIRH